MFRHEAPDDDLAARVDQLMVDVLVDDERERLDGLRARLSPDFVYVGPDAVFDGAEGLRPSPATVTTGASRPPCAGPRRSTSTSAGSGSPGREWSGT
jgi:hypothetical protein